MNQARCKCGHLRIHHLGVDGNRGRCPSTITYMLAMVPSGFSVPPTTKILNPNKESDVKIWNEIIDGYRPGMRKRVMKRGYAYLDCPCPMFHLVDIGQVKVVTPAPVKLEIVKK